MLRAVFGEQLLDSVPRIEQVAQGLIMVERRNDKRHILAHIRLAEPRAIQHFLGRIGQVRSEYMVDDALAVRLVERFQSAGSARRI